MAIQAQSIKATFERHLSELNKLSEQQLVEDRYNKFRAIGAYTE
ncbi:hypothetical protein [Staphylococcus succinus]